MSANNKCICFTKKKAAVVRVIKSNSTLNKILHWNPCVLLKGEPLLYLLNGEAILDSTFEEPMFIVSLSLFDISIFCWSFTYQFVGFHIVVKEIEISFDVFVWNFEYQTSLLQLIFCCVALRSSFRTNNGQVVNCLIGNMHFLPHRAQIPAHVAMTGRRL